MNFHLVKSQDLFAEWTKFPIRDVEDPDTSEDSSSEEGWQIRYLKPDSAVLMDDYLMIIAQDDFHEDDDCDKDKLEPVTHYTHLLAVDLRNLSVQQVQIDDWDWEGCCLYGQGSYTLKRYNKNQIIAFGDTFPEMITIESFQRKTYSVMTVFDSFSSPFREM